MALRIALDKSFPQLESQMKYVIEEGSSNNVRPIFRNIYEDGISKIVLVTGLRSDEEQGILEDLRLNGFPTRSVAN